MKITLTWKLFRAWQGKDFREANGNDLKEWEGTVPLHSHPAALGNTGLALAPLPRPGSSRLQLCPVVLRVTAPSPSITPLPGLIQHMKPLPRPCPSGPLSAALPPGARRAAEITDTVLLSRGLQWVGQDDIKEEHSEPLTNFAKSVQGAQRTGGQYHRPHLVRSAVPAVIRRKCTSQSESRALRGGGRPGRGAKGHRHRWGEGRRRGGRRGWPAHRPRQAPRPLAWALSRPRRRHPFVSIARPPLITAGCALPTARFHAASNSARYFSPNHCQAPRSPSGCALPLHAPGRRFQRGRRTAAGVGP